MKRTEAGPGRAYESRGAGGRRPRSNRSLERLQGRPGHLSVPILAAAVAAALLLRIEPLPPAPPAGPLAGVTVVLDPGHGGADPGAVREGVSEAALSYRIASTLASVLRQEGASVRFTVRSATLEAEEGAPLLNPEDASFEAEPARPIRGAREAPENLYRRAETARQIWSVARPQAAFLSLHFDALRRSGPGGGRVFFDRRDRAPSRLAQILARYLAAEGLARLSDDTPQPRDLGVLNPERNPIPDRVLVELATLSNAQDRAEAIRPAWRARVARTLADGLIEWAQGLPAAPR